MGLELLVATIVSNSSDVFKGGAEIWSFSSDTILYQVSPIPTDYPSTSRPSPGLYAKDNESLGCQFSVPSAGHWAQGIP